MPPKRRKDANKERRMRLWFGHLFWPLIVPAFCLIVAGGLWAVDAPTWVSQKVSELNTILLQKMGLRLEVVEIAPLKYTEVDVVLKAAEVTQGQMLFQVDPEQVRERVEKLPWVWSAVVQRRLPNKLIIRVSERQPMAIWHRDKKMFLVDKEGVTLSDKTPEMFKGLPVIAGQDAAKNAPPLFQALEQFQSVHALVKTAVCVGKRRWNLLLNSGTQVYLPEKDLQAAFSKLNELAERKLLDTLVIKVVDLRLEGRIVLKVTPEASLKLQTKGTAKET
jgi:cell division protein FtsQ